jgi:hypothetical protein
MAHLGLMLVSVYIHRRGAHATTKMARDNARLKFESRSRELLPRGRQSFALPDIATIRAPAILRETSEGTSYQMVRLVFRPYTQV